MLPASEPPPPDPNPYQPPDAPVAGPVVSGWIAVLEHALMWVAVSPVILMASGVAFVATCLPVGALLGAPLLGHGNPGARWSGALAYLISLIAALATATALIRVIHRVGRKAP